MDNEKITSNAECKGEYVPRRMRITKRDLKKFGFTVGCAGCRAANRGSTAVGHSGAYRKKIMAVKLYVNSTLRQH